MTASLAYACDGMNIPLRGRGRELQGSLRRDD